MFTAIVVVVALIVVVFAVIVTLQADEYRVVRRASIAAPAAEVFACVNDFHLWEDWSPWAKIDPSAKNTYAGAPAGEGAVFSWSGNNKVGEGRMTLTESQPNDLIRIRLDFVRPFPSSALAEFAFQPGGNQTAVTWTMTGSKNFVSKAFGMFMDCDKMIGADFEKGLAQLKSTAENAIKH